MTPDEIPVHIAVPVAVALWSLYLVPLIRKTHR